jgi:hypothetical protein
MTVYCTKHAVEMVVVDREEDSDGTQKMVKEYCKGECGCEVELVRVVG